MVVGTFQGATTINPNCQTQCGNVTVPYPFGIGTNCSLDDESFNLTCDTSTELPKLFIGNGNLDIYSISDSELRIFTIVSSRCYNQSGFVDGYTSWINVREYPAFAFSTKNKFTVIGCDDYALITGTDGDSFSSGCFGLCQKAPVPNGRQCSGISCCQISIPKGLSYYNVTLGSLHDHSDVWTFNECSHGFLVEEGVFEFRGADDLTGDYQTFEDRV